MRLVEGKLVAAILFGVIQRGIRIANEVDDIRRIFGVVSDTHAGRHEHLVSLHEERVGEPVQQHLRELGRVLPLRPVRTEVIDYDRKLVTGQAAEY